MMPLLKNTVSHYRPGLASAAVRHFIAPAWACWEGSPYLRHARELRKTQFDQPEVIAQRQLQKLRAIVNHAVATAPFWRERFRQAGVRPQEFDSLEDLRRLPLLTKSEMRSSAERLHSHAYRTAAVHHRKTSGSTGVAVAVTVDEAAQQFQRACTLRSDEWTGWRLGEPVACIWGSPDYLKRGWRGRLRNQLLERACYLDTLRMDRAAMEQFAAMLRDRPPALLFGHAHSLYLFAEFCRCAGGAGFRPRGILSTAMVLHDWERDVIEETFGTRVTNRYGCEEVSLIACQCEHHEGLHVNADSVHVEVLRADGTPCLPGEVGAVVVTDLINRAMPLIRYQIGDMAAATGRRCPCGRGLPLLERIEGRSADFVVTPTGDLISGISLTENFAMLLSGVAQLQIVQETVQRFLFRIVRGPEWNAASQQRIAELVVARFGPQATYDIEFVERIPQEPSGKYRFCISKVPNPFGRHTATLAHGRA